MFQRFHKERNEGGFTLIELLVVILIIAILAAIAIPVFLNQRKKGWDSQSESALKNAATAVETVGAGNNGDYTPVDGETEAGTDLVGAGYNETTNVNLAVEADGQGYCITSYHLLSEKTHYYTSDTGEPSEYTTLPGAGTSAPACAAAATT